MKTFVTFRSETRIATLLCSSLTVLLTACGGGEPASTGQAMESRTAAQVVGGTAAAAGSASATATATGQVGDPAEAGFALQGYENGPFAVDDGSQPLTQLAAAPAPGALVPAVVVPPTTYKLYVSTSGNDNNAGTAAAPFRTLARAARATRPSTTVFVAPGTYTASIKTTISGSASGRIYYISTTKWGAKLVSSGSASMGWDNRGNYIDIIGFNVDGSAAPWKYALYNGGSYGVIRGNWVHHIAKNAACNGGGGSAIGIDAYYRGVKSDVIGNLVHDIGPAGCRYIQGIYVSTSGTVKNNVVYRVAEAAIHLWHDANNVIITNNTVTTSHTGIIVGGGDFYHTTGPSDYNRVNNNIVYDNGAGISEQGRTGTHNSYKNNLVYQNASYNFSLRNGLTHTGTVTSAPLFVAYTRTGTPDLRLTSSSPAIGRGTSLDALDYDFLELPRNATTGYDIGAYQH
jgi:hypothetical protein